jgi:hypothetical protein
MYDAGPAKPFRFLYMSGSNSQRDPAKKPWLLGDYSVMRVSVISLESHLGRARELTSFLTLYRAPSKTSFTTSPPSMMPSRSVWPSPASCQGRESWARQ